MLCIHMIEMQIAILIAMDFHIAPELHIHGMLQLAYFPRIADPHPHIRNFYLVALIVNFLTEQTALIADAVSIHRQVLCCRTVHETRCQSAQAAIAKSCIPFHGSQVLIIDPQFFQSLGDNVIDAEVPEIACQHSAEQKLHGEVVHLLGLIL